MTHEGQSLPTAGPGEWVRPEAGRKLVTKDPFTGKATCLHLWAKASSQPLLVACAGLLLHHRYSSPIWDHLVLGVH